MMLFEHGFQSKILQTINQICSLDFLNLAKNYSALFFMTVYKSVFGHYHSLWETHLPILFAF